MPIRAFSARFRVIRAAAVCCAFSWLLAGSGPAALTVFHSERDDLVDSGVAEIRGHTLVHVYFSNGPVGVPPGGRCTASGGDEVCQWAVEFGTTGNLMIVDIDWASGFELEDPAPVSPDPPASTRRGTGGFAHLGDLGATKLATVAVTGTTGELRLYTPTGFGFVDKDGVPQTVAAEGVLLGRAAETGWKTVSLGNEHTCGIAASGDLRCWGTALSGLATPPGGTFDSVAVGHDPPFCALARSGLPGFERGGEISCWGTGYTPPALTFYEQIVAGEFHFCGLTPNLELECWDSSTGAAALGVPTAPAPGPFLTITRGFNHVCGLFVDSSVGCWGDNTWGQSTQPSGGFVDLAGGARHTCGILPGEDGAVTCWGDDTDGQASPPTPDPCPSYPVSCPFVDISAGDSHTCGLLADQTVTCWGDDTDGQSSGPDGLWQPGPDHWNSAPATYKSLSVGSTHSCAIRTDGTLDCWGVLPSSESPPVVPMPLVAAGDSHACRAGTDGAVECWGAATPGPGSLPTEDVVQLDAGEAFTCALEASGDVHCWGDDTNDQIANEPGGTFSQVVTGAEHACGLRPNSTVVCWGLDSATYESTPGGPYQQLSAGSFHICGIETGGELDCWGDLVVSSDPGPYVQVSSGTHHACALGTDGTVTCFGNGSDVDGQVTGVLPGVFDSISVDSLHSCGVRPSGTVECWGLDTQGQSTPPDGIRFASVAAGGTDTNPGYSCAPNSGGGLICWGEDGSGQSTPVGDTDDDGFSDAADNCPFDANTDQADSDNDGVGDVCDNCVALPNADQFDRDDDFVGDFCDFCPDNPNASAPGSLCLTTIALEPVGGAPLAGGASVSLMASSLLTGDAYDVVLTCPLQSIGKIELAVIMPPEVTGINFGPGCNQTNCVNGSLGATVDEANSRVLTPPVTGAPDPTYYYFRLAGELDGSNPKLCNAGDPPTVLAQILVDAFPTESVNPSFTQEGVDDIGIAYAGFDGEPLQAPDSTSIDYGDFAYSVGVRNAAYEILVRPELNANPDGRRWSVSLVVTAPSDVPADSELLEVTLGFTVPVGVTLGDIEWEGCGWQDWSSGNHYGLCLPSTDPNGVEANIDPENSFSVGPIMTPPAGIEPNTFYVKLRGRYVTADSSGETLIPVPNDIQPGDKIVAKLGTINFPEGGGYPLDTPPPVTTLDGALEVARDPCTSSCQQTVFLLPGEDPIVNEILLTGTGSSGADYDGDGRENDTDICVFAYNPFQEDTGGRLSIVPNGRGDACECGDMDGNGIVGQDGFGAASAQDVEVLHEALAGLGHEDALEFCSIDNDSDCDILDLIIMDRATNEVTAPLLNALCIRNVPSSTLGTDP